MYVRGVKVVFLWVLAKDLFFLFSVCNKNLLLHHFKTHLIDLQIIHSHRQVCYGNSVGLGIKSAAAHHFAQSVIKGVGGGLGGGLLDS